MRYPIDIEGALQAALDGVSIDGETVKAYAPPLPDFLLPCIYIERTGGGEQDRVIDRHIVEIDTRAETWAKAQSTANRIIGYLRELEGAEIGGVPCYAVELNSMPYNNYDPEHQDVPRVTFSVLITTRTIND